MRRREYTASITHHNYPCALGYDMSHYYSICCACARGERCCLATTHKLFNASIEIRDGRCGNFSCGWSTMLG